MNTIFYLYRKTLKNRVRVALRKPATYFFLVCIVFYLTAFPYSLKMLAEEVGAASPEGMVALLTALAFWLIPGNLIAYAKRKGLVYRNCDIHFLFPSPVSPKMILLYAHLRTLPMHLLLNLFAAVCSGMIFKITFGKLLLYFLFSLLVENLLECGFMIILYGTERLKEKQRGWVIRAAYGLVLVLAVIAVSFYLRQGMSWDTVLHFLHSDAVQLVPVIGGYVSVLHLLFTGMTTVNCIGTVLYFLLFAIVLFVAYRMKCTGAYYEDAIKFAEDYEEVLAKQKQGDTTMRIGKKRKYGKASVQWQGIGAKALFYRQLLEYKKNRFFIFDLQTVLALLAGAAIAFFCVKEGGFDGFDFYVIPAVSAYLIFCFSGMGGKWAKELKSPYTYMLPDSAFAKLWNATALQLLQNGINGLLITIPGAVVMKMPPVMVLLCILSYAVLSSNKLYALAVAEIAVGGVMGMTGKQLFQMLIQGLVIGIAALGAVLGNVLGGIYIAFLLMDLVLMAFTLVFMIIAALNFDRMEA